LFLSENYNLVLKAQGSMRLTTLKSKQILWGLDFLPRASLAPDKITSTLSDYNYLKCNPLGTIKIYSKSINTAVQRSVLL